MRIENTIGGTIHVLRPDLRALVGTVDDQSWNPGRSHTSSFAQMG